MMTGMRSWIGASSVLASVVMVANVLSFSPSGERHSSQMPAKATGSPSTLATAKGVFAFRVVAPFVVNRRRDETAALRERLSEHAGLRHGLRSGVDRLAGFLEVLRKVGQQAPLQRV